MCIFQKTGDTLSNLTVTSKKFNSCSTIFIDDSTVSQPNLKNTIKWYRFPSCPHHISLLFSVSFNGSLLLLFSVALAVYYHIRNRNSGQEMHQDVNLEIFNEKLHPLTDDYLPEDYGVRDPDHRVIYRFLRLLFSSAQLTAEVAIITLVSFITKLLVIKGQSFELCLAGRSTWSGFSTTER